MTTYADAAITSQSVVDDVNTAPTREGADVTYGVATLGVAANTGPVSVLRVVLHSDSTAEQVDTIRVNINRVDVVAGNIPSVYVDGLNVDATLSGVAIYVDDGDNVFERAVDDSVTATSIAFTDTVGGVAADSIYTVTIDFPSVGDLVINPNALTLFIVVRGGAGLVDGDQFAVSTNLSNWVFSKGSAGTATNTSGTTTGDVTAPTIAAGNAVTLDDDADGLLDGAQITWSESIADVTFANFASATATFDITAGTTLIDAGLAADADGDTGDFTTANRLPKIDPNGPPRTSDTINNIITFIIFGEDTTPATKTLDELNTEATPNLDMAGLTVTDLAGNPIDAVVALASIDKAPPVIFQSLYLDADGNGKIDEVQVQFSENIDRAAFANNNGWTVAGFNFKDFTTDPPVLISAASSADPPTTATGDTTDAVRLLLKEKTDFSTGIDLAVDQVTYSAAFGDVADLSTSPNELDNMFVGTAPEVDRASPILIDAKTGDIITTPPGGQIDRYVIRFTEPVEARGGEADFILLDDFAVASLNDNLTSTLTLVIRETGFIDTGIRPGLGVNIDIVTSSNAGIVDFAKDRLGANASNGLVAPSATTVTSGAVTFNLVVEYQMKSVHLI